MKLVVDFLRQDGLAICSSSLFVALRSQKVPILSHMQRQLKDSRSKRIFVVRAHISTVQGICCAVGRKHSRLLLARVHLRRKSVTVGLVWREGLSGKGLCTNTSRPLLVVKEFLVITKIPTSFINVLAGHSLRQLNRIPSASKCVWQRSRPTILRLG